MKYKKAYYDDPFMSRKCPVCGKEFLIRSKEHAYKIPKKSTGGYAYVCSWSCVREYERTHVTKYAAKHQQKVEQELKGIQE